MRKKLEQFREWCDYGLRRVCGRMTPARRLVIILLLLAIFGAVNLYITIRAIYGIGREDARRELMETGPEPGKNQHPDNFNPLKDKEDE